MAIQTPIRPPGSLEPPAPPGGPPGWQPAPPIGGSPAPIKPSRRIAKKWWWIGGIGVIAIIAIAAGAASSKPAPSAGALPATTAAPTANAPTAAPTVQATAAPTAAPVAASVTLSGRGDAVVKVPAPYDTVPALLTGTYPGNANFIVVPLDSSNVQGSSLFNEIGPFRGTIPSNFTQGSSASRLQITATESWRLTFADLSTAPTSPDGRFSGKGDLVFLDNAGALTEHATHNGQANFIVDYYPTDGSSVSNLINEIGHYDGVVPVQAGPAYIAVTADGSWTFTSS